MEKILKIQSEQGFSETAKPKEFVNSKLVDFIIPGSGTYDLGKSYININMETVSAQQGTGGNTPAGAVASDTALYNNDIRFFTDDLHAKSFKNPASIMVRNADMFSANRGMVESIRRVNTLRSILGNINDDKAEQHAALDNMGSLQGRRGVGNATSSLIQVIGSNVNVSGTLDTTQKAKLLARDYRIPLSDLFGVGSAQWNGDVFGDTRIHLELQPNLLAVQQLGGSEDTDVFDAAGVNVTFGAIDNVTLAAASTYGTKASGVPLITTLTYKDFQLNLPFYVGQAIAYNGTSSVSGAIGTDYVIIDAIEFNEGTNANAQPTGTGKCQIWTRTSLHTAAGAPENITAQTIKAHTSDTAVDQIRINRAEIVLSESVGVTGPSKIDYRTYSTEETQGNSLATFNKQVIVEPNAQNLIVAHCDSNKISPDRAWTNYRIAINNVDQTGNRDIPYAKPLHKDRILRTLQNRGEEPSNTSLQLLQTGVAQQAGGGNQISFYPILETLPLTSNQKLVNLELQSGGAEDVVFYKELVKTI